MKMAKTKKVVEQKDEYEATLGLNGLFYHGNGATIDEALLMMKPEMYKTRGFLTVKHGERNAKLNMIIPLMKRLFGGGGTTTQKMTLGFVTNNIKMFLGEK